MNKEIKPIEFMSVERKIIYAKILGLMLSISITEEKMVSYYRLLGQIRLDIESRMLLHDFVINPTEELDILCKGLVEGLVDQEYNIIRFSLTKDLIILMRAGGQTLETEHYLFNEARELLKIPEEYMSYFVDEYENDQVVFNEDYNETLILKHVKNQLAISTSLGIPTSYLCYRGYLKQILEYRKRKGLLLSLQRLGLIKRKQKKVRMSDLITALSLGFISYSLTKFLLNKKVSNENELKEMVYTRAQILHERAIAYMIKDINFLKTELQLIDENQNVIEETLQPRVILLEGALNRIRNSKPVLL